MKFMYGKHRYYEKLMQLVPGHERQYSDTSFKYKYADVACDYCSECRCCNRELCPHIMDNLGDLVRDKQFMRAIILSRNCCTNHRRTLEYLRVIYERMS